ncbi:MAG: hypothetical protein JWO08_2463 [Verrucomicrobiaceae bacterium]|nr:hypothetical protein [Verrucomicrobiaceae bacterium]
MRCLCFALLLVASSTFAGLPSLKVAEDHRHLVTDQGKPFFYLGDTAWELFHRLTSEEADLYLTTRAKQGFNVVHAVALAEYDVSVPNAYGELPLENLDPTKPREAYFKHVDYIIDKAESLGIYVGFLPTWGDKWNKAWGKGPEIFTPQNAKVYGEWLGRRYKDKPIIWILGGDRSVDNDNHRAIIRAMAAGLKAGDGGRHLISFHPKGGKNSSDYWPDESWLDFHEFQSGHHAQAIHNFDFNAKNLALPALKPTLDGEPCYEDHPVRGIAPKTGVPTVWFDEYDARRAAWWSMLSGACGHVYGDHSVWQFYDGKQEPVFHARTPWQKAIEYPGAVQVGQMKAFFEKIEWQKLRRDDGFLEGLPKDLKREQQPMAAVATDGSFAVVYVPDTKAVPISPNFAKLAFDFEHCEARSFNPKTGSDMSGVVGIVSGQAAYIATAESKEPGFNGEPMRPDAVLVFSKKK